MEQIKNAPEMQVAPKGQIISEPTQDKDIKRLSPLQKKVYYLLCQGQYRTVEIALALHIADPRRVIKSLRDAGIAVSDVWDKSVKYKAHFKRYFISKGVHNG